MIIWIEWWWWILYDEAWVMIMIGIFSFTHKTRPTNKSVRRSFQNLFLQRHTKHTLDSVHPPKYQHIRFVLKMLYPWLHFVSIATSSWKYGMLPACLIFLLPVRKLFMLQPLFQNNDHLILGHEEDRPW